MPLASMLWKKRVNCWRSLVEAVVMSVTALFVLRIGVRGRSRGTPLNLPLEGGGVCCVLSFEREEMCCVAPFVLRTFPPRAGET